MDKILIYRERFLKFLSSKGKYIQFFGRFAGGLLLFYVINNIYGYASVIGEPFMLLIMGLICVFVPVSAIYMMFLLVVILQLLNISIEVSLMYIFIMGLYHLIYQWMFPKNKVLFLMTPIFYFFHVPAVLPIFLGVFVGLGGLPAILMGTVNYYLAIIIKNAVTQMDNGTVSGPIYSLILEGTANNKELLLCIVVFMLVTVVVSGIRKLQTAYGWYVDILAGGVTYLLSMMIGGYFIDSQINIISQIFMIIFSICIVMIIQFFYNVIDYTRQETFEFEDEEYYYYVKAIPKISVEEEDINIKKITMPARRFYLKKKDNHNEGEKS